MSVSTIVLGVIGKAFQTTSGMLADQKVTIGEIWVGAMGLGREIVNLVPGAADKVVYRLSDGDKVTVGELLLAIEDTGTAALVGFKVFDFEVGKV